MQDPKIDNLLCAVQKPSRYLGNEINLPQKDWGGSRVRFLLAFPDVYEVGMSHLGLLLLYDILNQQEWIGAERVYAVWPDLEARYRTRGRPLVSLESSTPLSHFDVVGFSLQYELSYTNILTMLELGEIPSLAEARGVGLPLIIGGGPGAFNPEPVAPFFDAFVLGDGEEAILEIAEIVREWKTQGGERRDILIALSELEGVYVPEFFQPQYSRDGRIAAITPRFTEKAQVRKRVLTSLDVSRPSGRPLVPCSSIIHDRLNLELARGCTRGCRFCQAGMIYRPVRERSPHEVLKMVVEGLASTGYDELSLLSLSIGDYGSIRPLLNNLVSCHPNGKVAISLPSLRVGTLDETMIEAISRVRKTGFTLAPEAGTERLRRVINKGVSEGDLLDTIRTVYSAGWPLIKLYFMMGLPTEEGEDHQALVELALKVWREAATHKPGRRLHVSVSTFVPKPHTPFQWAAQLTATEMEKNLAFFKQRLRKRGLQFKWHTPWQSMLEGVFSRGDRRLAEVLLRAQQLGCRFDGWSEQLRPDLWRQAFRETGVDPSYYAERARDLEEILPWSHLDCGVSKEYLWEEYERAFAEVATSDCRAQACNKCGVCDHDEVRLRLYQGMEAKPVEPNRLGANRDGLHPYRLVFAKTGSARFLSHLEMASVFQRAMKRADLPLAYSRGYKPSPRISFGDALPLGLESLAEVMKVILWHPAAASEIADRLNVELPTGLKVLEVEEERSDLQTTSKLVTYEVIFPDGAWPVEGSHRFERQLLVPFRQKTKRGEVVIPLKNRVTRLETLNSNRIRFSLIQARNDHIRVRDLLMHLFGLSTDRVQDTRIVKTSDKPI